MTPHPAIDKNMSTTSQPQPTVIPHTVLLREIHGDTDKELTQLEFGPFESANQIQSAALAMSICDALSNSAWMIHAGISLHAVTEVEWERKALNRKTDEMVFRLFIMRAKPSGQKSERDSSPKA